MHLIETVADRITLFSKSEGEEIELDTHPEIIWVGLAGKLLLKPVSMLEPVFMYQIPVLLSG